MAEIRASSISNLAGTGPIDLEFQSAARMWFAFSNSPPVVQNSLNVSSLTDDGVGLIDVNITSAFTDVYMGVAVSSHSGVRGVAGLQTTVSQVATANFITTTGSYEDRRLSGAVHGDLA